MEKMRCDIIQDLIPSYVDGVCSDATRECVEEHMKSCEECRRMTALCREKGIADEQIDQRGLDGLKKIKRLIQCKGYACCGLVIFNLGYMGISILGNGEWSRLSFSAHLVMLITCMCLVLLSGMGFKGKRTPGWPELTVGAGSVLTELYIVLLTVYLVKEIQRGADYVWGRELYRTGPFLTWQIGLGNLALLVCFLFHLSRMIRKDKNGNWLLCLDVACCYVLSKCHSILGNMLEPEKFLNAFIRETAIVAAIGLLGVGASVLIGMMSRRKNSLHSGGGGL